MRIAKTLILLHRVVRGFAGRTSYCRFCRALAYIFPFRAGPFSGGASTMFTKLTFPHESVSIPYHKKRDRSTGPEVIKLILCSKLSMKFGLLINLFT